MLMTLPSAFAVQGTADVYFGPADPATPAQWESWHQNLLQVRAATLRQIGLPKGRYEDPASAWSDGAFRHYLLFMYDQSFLPPGGHYRTAEWLAETERKLGKINAVILWQAYPQLGLDSRTQFDFYRQMPGGLRALRTEVSDVLHARGVRVFLDFNPWDAQPDYDELASIVADLDADGVMLDTMNEVPASLRAAIDKRKKGVVLSPERRPSDDDLKFARNSWAQWYEIGDEGPLSKPAIYQQKWLIPQHMQLAIRRWDTDRRRDIVFSFFNGSGLLLWDNVFGTWNPYQTADRKLLAETAVLLEEYRDILTAGEWAPLLPTGAAGLDMNRWVLADRILYTFRNRTDHALNFSVPRGQARGLGYFFFWSKGGQLKEGERVTVPPFSTQALVLDSPSHALKTLQLFERAARAAEAPATGYEQVTPIPVAKEVANPPRAAHLPEGFSQIPGGTFEMVTEHEKRESGCYPFGATLDAMWGWFFKDALVHRITSRIMPFAMKTTAVTQAEFLRFVRESGYKPADPARFMLYANQDSLPVTYVSLDDARAYAKWKGERLPTEAEWQWAAQSGLAGNRWPWGNLNPELALADAVNRGGKLAAADANRAGATSQGIVGLSGNSWEWTESEWSDGHNRFALLRGGTYLPAQSDLSEWMLPRGAHPNSFHAKYLLLGPALDRSEAISFRTVVDLD